MLSARSTPVLGLALLLFAFAAHAVAAPARSGGDTEARIDALLAQMTLEDKIGQLNQYSSVFDVTGPAPTESAQKLVYDQIRQGLVGSMLNVTGAEATRKAQELAVEGSRLHIP